jgi:hypothetical protein
MRTALDAGLPEIGAAPPLARPSFPQCSNYFPAGVQMDLLPFGQIIEQGEVPAGAADPGRTAGFAFEVRFSIAIAHWLCNVVISGRGW